MDASPGGRPAWGAVQVGAAGQLVNPPWVYALDVSSDGRAAAAACGDGVVRTWALHAGEEERCRRSGLGGGAARARRTRL